MNSFDLKEISPDEYKEWFEQHLTVLQGRSPFHQPAWLNAVAKGSRYEVVVIGIFDGASLVAATPGFLIRFGSIRLFGSPLPGTMTPYLGPLGINLGDFNGGVYQLMMDCTSYARAHWRVSRTEFTFREPSTPPSEDLGPSWERRKTTHYSLDLTCGEKALWAKMQTRFRTSIRKCERLGMRIVPLDNTHSYYQMLNETLARRATSSWHSESFFQRLLDNVPAEFLWAVGVEYQGKMIAAGIFVHDACEVHYLSGASLSEYRSLPTSYLLHWHVVTSAVRAGLRIYDLGGRPNANIDLFKRSLSPQVATYWSLTHSSTAVRYAQKFLLPLLPYLRRTKHWVTSR